MRISGRIQRVALVVLLLSYSRCSTSFSITHFPLRRTSKVTGGRGVLYQVATAATVIEDSEADKTTNQQQQRRRQRRQRLSRPERKALERERKQKKYRRKHNFNERAHKLKDKRASGEGRYELHSQRVSQLDNATSTADDVLSAIKRAQNLHDAHDLLAIERFLLEQTHPDQHFYGYRGSLLARLAVAALHMGNHKLAKKAILERNQQHADSTRRPMEAAAIIRGLLRVHNVTDAWDILNDELSLPSSNGLHGDAAEAEAASAELIKYRALSLASIISRHFFEGEPVRAVAACETLASMGSTVRECTILNCNNGTTVAAAAAAAEPFTMPWTRLMRGAAHCQSMIRADTLPSTWENSQWKAGNVELPCNVVYAVLGAMSTFPSDNSDRLYEMLSNALVRRVVFVTGAVAMEGCPPADRGEACFIGRSNVGKSSLINMITARKSLAYTSKRPGKTQQFNFFAVNDVPDKEKEVRYGDVVDGERDSDSFYIVDLPGFGYAKVPEQQKAEWLAFMREYLADRKTLRTVFHLVDGRHGPTEEDAVIMKQVACDLRKDVAYVVVLTKADKNVKGADKKRPGKVSDAVMDSLRTAMRESGVKNSPVILTSAETKLGRDDVWRYLRKAAES